MSFLKLRVKPAVLLGFLASLLVLWACHVDNEEAAFFEVKADPAWTRYDSVAVLLQDESGITLDTLFHGVLTSTDQLKKLDAGRFDGGKIQIVLVGFLDDKVAKRETRPFDGRTGESGDKIVIVLIPIDPDPMDTLTLRIEPRTAKLYTGGPDLTLAPVGSAWQGKALEWSSSSPAYATVAAGKVTPVAPGKTFIKAVSGDKKDSSEITVVTDAPVLEAGADTVVPVNTAAIFKVKVTQEYGTVAMLKWSLDGDTAWDDSASNPAPAGNLYGNAPKTYSEAAVVTIRFYVRDSEGNAVTAERKVTVSKQVPKITSLLKDAEIKVQDSVSFTAQAEVDPGLLKKYSWNYGDASPVVSGTLSSAKADLAGGHRYAKDGSFKVSLTVEDDKGNAVTSSVTVKVNPLPVPRPPIVKAGKDTAVTLGALVNLHGSASDSDGTIAKMEWNINGTGFVKVSKGDTSFTPAAAGKAKCIFKATDNEGLTAEDTVEITVNPVIAGVLSSLTASAGQLSPAFAPGTLPYTATTSESTTTVTAVVAAGSGATLKINGVATASGTPSAPIPLAAGATTSVPILVTAKDGTTKTYTIAFTRSSLPDLVFTETALVSKTATRVDFSYTIKNNGGTAIPSLVNISIQNYYSSNTVFNDTGDVAAGGAILNVAKALAPGESYSGTFYASGAVPAGKGYLTSKIDWGDSVAESNEANNTVAKLVLIPPTADAGADTLVAAGTRINLHGKASDAFGTVAKVEWKFGAAAFAVAPAETFFTAPAVGGTTVKCILRVTDDDGLTDEDTVDVTVSPSADADLSALTLTTATLAPAFIKTTTAYTASVANTVTSLTVTPTVANAGSTVKVNTVAVASGTASAPVALAIGPTTINVEVTAQSGLKKTYVVTVTRAGSHVADLSALTASAGALSPAFAAGTLGYTLTTSSASTTVTATVAAGSGATIKVNGVATASGSPSAAIALPEGSITDVTIQVTAQDGFVKTYSIAITVPGSTLPDLAFTSYAITAIAADRIDYTYTIKNMGGTTIPNLYNVSIQNFYSVNNVFNDAGDAAAGGSILGLTKALAPGESYTGTFAAYGAPASGMKYVTFKIDWGEIIAESNETNNTGAMLLSP
ncbi:MAG: Cadherin-like beta sandwich domain protein [Fibrobacteres bacterium]|nr:Cadherin-like beta sandwich domain protein [Fibrobacterota bacterium]